MTRRPTILDIERLGRKAEQIFIVGIDPGVHTGLAVWNKKEKSFLLINSTSICIAQKWISQFPDKHKLFVRIEDARLRKWFGNADQRQIRSGAGIREGVGSVKRDCQIWEEFLLLWNIPYELVAPKNSKTKLDAKLFSNYTGWKEKTNEHARDAAMLVYNFN